MSYNPPGIRVDNRFVNETVTPIESELPTCIVGPLYEVFIKEEVSDEIPDSFLFSFAESVSIVGFSWPSKRIGTVVDLAGTNNGYIDSQRFLQASVISIFMSYLFVMLCCCDSVIQLDGVMNWLIGGLVNWLIGGLGGLDCLLPTTT